MIVEEIDKKAQALLLEKYARVLPPVFLENLREDMFDAIRIPLMLGAHDMLDDEAYDEFQELIEAGDPGPMVIYVDRKVPGARALLLKLLDDYALEYRAS